VEAVYDLSPIIPDDKKEAYLKLFEQQPLGRGYDDNDDEDEPEE
jgi:hypothetical protein